MKIKVIRDYSGQEGTDVDKNVFAGSEHHVSRVRGSELFASGLVEILSDEDSDVDGPVVMNDDGSDDDHNDQSDDKNSIPPITADRPARRPRRSATGQAEA